EAQPGEEGVDLSGARGLVEALAGLAPRGADVDEDMVPVAPGAGELALYDVRHLAVRRGRDEVDRERLRRRGAGDRGERCAVRLRRLALASDTEERDGET